MPTTTDADRAGEASGFALFDTPIGCCAIAWRGESIVRTALPDKEPIRLRGPFSGFDEQRPPPAIAAAIDAIVRLLSGERGDLSKLRLDLSSASPFERQVYAAALAIPPGEIRTYGELAAAIGAPEAAQAVGRALGRNPCPIIVPCHRILAPAAKAAASPPRGVLRQSSRCSRSRVRAAAPVRSCSIGCPGR